MNWRATAPSSTSVSCPICREPFNDCPLTDELRAQQTFQVDSETDETHAEVLGRLEAAYPAAYPPARLAEYTVAATNARHLAGLSAAAEARLDARYPPVPCQGCRRLITPLILRSGLCPGCRPGFYEQLTQDTAQVTGNVRRMVSRETARRRARSRMQTRAMNKKKDRDEEEKEWEEGHTESEHSPEL